MKLLAPLRQAGTAGLPGNVDVITGSAFLPASRLRQDGASSRLAREGVWLVMDESRDVEISVVVPVYNEQANLPILISKLVEVFDRLGSLYEMIFVDDGSSDGSRKLLKEMASQVPSLRVVGLKQNRGLSTALLAGMREARGKIIVTLDSDLQNDPEDIPRLLELSRPLRHGHRLAPEEGRPVA